MPDEIEIGNLINDHSRGKFPIPSRSTYHGLMYPLFEAMKSESYGIEFSNDTFEMHPYCWCDEKTCVQCGTGTQFNFLYKKTGFGLNWYKYALRASHTNVETNEQSFKEMIDDCIKSLGQLSYTFYLNASKVTLAADTIDYKTASELAHGKVIDGLVVTYQYRCDKEITLTADSPAVPLKDDMSVFACFPSAT